MSWPARWTHTALVFGENTHRPGRRRAPTAPYDGPAHRGGIPFTAQRPGDVGRLAVEHPSRAGLFWRHSWSRARGDGRRRSQVFPCVLITIDGPRRRCLHRDLPTHLADERLTNARTPPEFTIRAGGQLRPTHECQHVGSLLRARPPIVITFQVLDQNGIEPPLPGPCLSAVAFGEGDRPKPHDGRRPSPTRPPGRAPQRSKARPPSRRSRTREKAARLPWRPFACLASGS